jgi:hypothetical protein
MWDEDLRDDSGMSHLLIYLFFSSKKWKGPNFRVGIEDCGGRGLDKLKKLEFFIDFGMIPFTNHHLAT